VVCTHTSVTARASALVCGAGRLLLSCIQLLQHQVAILPFWRCSAHACVSLGVVQRDATRPDSARCVPAGEPQSEFWTVAVDRSPSETTRLTQQP
jgi:hypothetical protein